MTLEDMLELWHDLNEFQQWSQKEPTFKKVRHLMAEHNLKGTGEVCVWLHKQISSNAPVATFEYDTASSITNAINAPSKPPPSQRSLASHPVKPGTIGKYLSVFWVKRYQFPGALDPIQMKSFCDPDSGHWDKTQDQLTVGPDGRTGGQRGLLTSMIINYEKDCKAKGITPEFYDD